MDEGDGVALMDPDLPPDNALMDKSASVQVGTHAARTQRSPLVLNVELQHQAIAPKVSPPSPPQPQFNMAEYHQLFVGTERLRCPEIVFQPSLTGEDQMGVMETLHYVLAR